MQRWPPGRRYRIWWRRRWSPRPARNGNDVIGKRGERRILDIDQRHHQRAGRFGGGGGGQQVRAASGLGDHQEQALGQDPAARHRPNSPTARRTRSPAPDWFRSDSARRWRHDRNCRARRSGRRGDEIAAALRRCRTMCCASWSSCACTRWGASRASWNMRVAAVTGRDRCWSCRGHDFIYRRQWQIASFPAAYQARARRAREINKPCQ